VFIYVPAADDSQAQCPFNTCPTNKNVILFDTSFIEHMGQAHEQAPSCTTRTASPITRSTTSRWSTPDPARPGNTALSGSYSEELEGGGCCQFYKCLGRTVRFQVIFEALKVNERFFASQSVKSGKTMTTTTNPQLYNRTTKVTFKASKLTT
jgi:hypothetical protein